MPDAVIAGGLAGLAALSLPIGAASAVLLRPSARVVAIVMAFGSGALIHAVVTELAVDPAQDLVTSRGFAPIWTWIVLAAGFLAGSLIYVGLTGLMERKGGGLHWRHRLRRKALDQKRAQAAPILQTLAHSRIASCLQPREAEELLPFVRTVEVRAGEAVFRRGDPSDGLYVVHDGAFEIQYGDHPSTAGPDRADAGGARSPELTAVGRGDVVGGMGMLGEQPRTASLVARDDGTLLLLSRLDFNHLAEKVPCIRKIVADIVAHDLYVSAHDATSVDPAEWQRMAVSSIEQLSHSEVDAAAERHGAESSPMAIFVGTLLDGIPESIAIGASFVSLATFAPTFVVAVFLSNFPEGVAGTSALLRAKLSVGKVMAMWGGLVVGVTAAGALGYLLLHDASPAVVAFLGAIAGGGVVAMLATTMMPEAYESGRAGVAPATIVGFLASLFLAVIELELH
jgi:CRP-like cAMP-binding protein